MSYDHLYKICYVQTQTYTNNTCKNAWNDRLYLKSVMFWEKENYDNIEYRLVVYLQRLTHDGQY